MVATATRTYYFETTVEEKNVLSVLQRYTAAKLAYYKYIKYKIGDTMKIVGVLQFVIRFSKTVLYRLFDEDGVQMCVLKPICRPLIMVHLRIYVLAAYHGVDLDGCQTCGEFSFGGRHTSIGHIMQPYMAALQHYKDYKKTDFYKFLPGAKQICEFKYFLLHTEHNV
jgi:hypothetical protein